MNLNIFRKLYLDEKGNVLIETNIAIVIILCVFLGSLYTLTAYRTKIVMEMAAREGSRQYQVSQSYLNAYKELEIGNVSGATVTATGTGVLVSKHLDFNIPIVGQHIFNLSASADYHKEDQILYYNNTNSAGYTGNPYK